jgi:Spy/CpxP family protein refolding chaperone
MNGGNRVWLSAFVVVIFAAGVATGVLLAEYAQARPSARSERPPGPVPVFLTEMLADELHMTREQRVRLDAIVEARRRNFEIVREEMRKRFEADASDLAIDIQSMLTPEQLAQFDAVVARVRAHVLKEQGIRDKG